MEILRDPIWQFLSVAVALITALVLFILQLRRKALTYDIKSNAPLFVADAKVSGRIAVLLDDIPVQSPRSIVVQIVNTGNLPIRSSDFEKPIAVTLGDHAKVLSAKISDTDPKNIHPEIDIEDSRIVLHPLLLNPKDSVILEALVDGASGQVTIDGRIVGISQLHSAPFRGKQNPFSWLGIFFFLGIALTFLGLALGGSKGRLDSIPDIILLFGIEGIAASLAGALFLGLVWLSWWRSERKRRG